MRWAPQWLLNTSSPKILPGLHGVYTTHSTYNKAESAKKFCFDFLHPLDNSCHDVAP